MAFGGMDFVTNNIGYIVGSQGKMIKTTDAGLTWVPLSSGTNDLLTSVFFMDENTGYIAGWSGVIKKTTDAGNTWISMQTGTYHDINALFFTDENNGYAICAYDQILKTTNGGSTWTIHSSETNLYLTSAFFTDKFTGYVVGDGGAIRKTTNGGAVEIPVISPPHERLGTYPNPAKDHFILELANVPENARLTILNIQGKQVMERIISTRRTQIDIRSLPSGVYFVRMQTDPTVEVGKIVKE
jgi:hypothetical protein